MYCNGSRDMATKNSKLHNALHARCSTAPHKHLYTKSKTDIDGRRSCHNETQTPASIERSLKLHCLRANIIMVKLHAFLNLAIVGVTRHTDP
eukprot:3952266-Amphidinium_carterae.1